MFHRDRAIRLLSIVFIYFISLPLLFGQQNYNHDQTPKKFNINLAYGIAYGIQGISIPPFTYKLSAGVEYTMGKTSVYALPGLTVGIAPVVFFHFETGINYRFMTIDYSTNSYKTQDDEIVRKFSNENINLGIRIKLNKKKKGNVFLWIKVGKSISEKGYNEEFPPIWNGYNAELRIVYKVFKLFKN
ncbi:MULTISPECIES: hypothetical protein [Aquimarina]|uniref:hypothetical protein n=1 Tax=Aquimarina TaxID=290174 RepID=UPI000D69D4EA|nr:MULTISPECIES: hypothetical protein [Aquimarina]